MRRDTSITSETRSRVAIFIVARDVARSIHFAKRVFGAVEISRPLYHSDGRLWSAELNISGSTLIFGETNQDELVRPGFIYIEVDNCDATYEAAQREGAKVLAPPGDQFYGMRDAGLEDSCGVWWWIAERVTHPSDAEIEARARNYEATRRKWGT